MTVPLPNMGSILQDCLQSTRPPVVMANNQKSVQIRKKAFSGGTSFPMVRVNQERMRE